MRILSILFFNERKNVEMTKDEFFKLALSFPGTDEKPHFERTGFKVINKRMFATYLENDNSANIFLTPAEQKVFCEMNDSIFPVPNKWGEKGATTFMLDNSEKEFVQEALSSAYDDIVKKKSK